LLESGHGHSAPVVLQSFVICPNSKLAAALESFCGDSGVFILRKCEEYPTPEHLARLIRIHAPNVVFISLQEPAIATELVHRIRAEAPGMPIVAVNELCDADVLLHAVRLGVQDFMSVSSAVSARECFDRIRARLSRESPLVGATDRVYCFLPAKPGVGTTTLAVNTALRIAQSGQERVFLGDFDIGCGIVQFLLRLQTEYSIQDATLRVHELDENLWPQIAHSRGNLDIVCSGPVRVNNTIDALNARRLIEYLRRTYNIVIADLSGNMDHHSMELMQEAKQIFLVAAPDLAALHLARTKVQFLDQFQLADKVALLLNRTAKTQMFTRNEIQDLVGVPVWLSFPDEPNTVFESAKTASALNAKSELARQIHTLADMLVNRKSPNVAAKKQRFVDYFSIVPGRDRYNALR
jgi:pilus assembly protein CpaE